MNINVNLIFANDQIVLQSNGDDFPKSIYLLEKLNLDYNMKISISKSKSLAFKGKDAVRTKLVIINKPIEQIQHFTYLGCDMTYNYDHDV